MTIESEYTPKEYTGNGATTTFAYTWKVLDEDHLVVTVDGVVQEITTDYSVTGVGTASGGNVVFVSAPTSSAAIVIERSTEIVQSTDIPEYGPMPALDIETAFDKGVMIEQELKEQLNRAPKFGAGFDTDAFDVILPEPTASYLLAVNSSADGFEFVEASSGGGGGGGLSASVNGFLVYKGSDSLTSRTLTGTSNEITISDGDGQSAAPTFGLSSTLDLTGKTVNVQDSTFSIKDNADATKIAKFQCSGITTATTRTITVPDADGTIMYTSAIGSTVQGYDAGLAALASYNTNGVLVQTANNTFAGRTLTGTSNEITITNGDGVSGNPTWSLPSAMTFTGKTITGGTYSGPTISSDLTFSTGAARTVSVSTSTTGAGNDLTLKSGSGLVGSTDSAAGTLILSTGDSTGSGSSAIDFYHATAGSTGTTTRSAAISHRFTSSSLSLSGGLNRTILVSNNTSGAGNSLTVQGGNAYTSATDVSGGTLTLKAGTSQGTGSSSIVVQAAKAGSTGTSTNSVQTIATFNATDLSMSPHGTSSGNTGELRFLELAANGSNYTGFKAPDSLAGNVVYTLPTAAPATSGYALVSDTSGAMSWSSAGGVSFPITAPEGAEGVIEMADSTDGAGDGMTLSAGDALTGGSNFSGGTLTLEGGDSTGTGTSSVIIKAAKAGSSGTSTNSTQAVYTITASNTTISPHTTGSGNTHELRFLELAANGTNYVGFKAPDSISSDKVYTLPSSSPSNNEGVLQSTGAGVMSFVNPPRLAGVTNISSNSAVDITLGNYSMHLITLHQISCATDGAILWARILASGTPYTGASDYAWSRVDTTMTTSSSATASGDEADAKIVMTGAVGNSTNESVSGWIHAEKTSSAYIRIRWNLVFSGTTTNFSSTVGGGVLLNSGTVSSLRLMWDTGNFGTTGNIYHFTSNTSTTGQE